MRRLMLAAAVLAVSTLGLAGCGDELTGRSMSQADRDKMVKYAECMKEYGVQVPVPDPNGGPAIGGGQTADPNDPKELAARAACERFAPPLVADQAPPAGVVEHALKMAACLREQGIAAKDPKPGENNLTLEEGAAESPEKLRAAYATCTQKYPAPEA
ncbi:hypothetical protein GT755_35130 [Herbidospora sp. NEAU-GS84]|uniref:Lipoprotein n=1 Tax=Herbidospora solisilvae TaxID=2696284 RepID=A0A7C9N5P0_9ACTN|nr:MULTISPECIES: hypothetical protein [Herbidospora]NAS26889.1 hypothetical protein [Herbidospora solisilvae]